MTRMAIVTIREGVFEMADSQKVRPPRAIRLTLDDRRAIDEISALAWDRLPYVTNGGEYMVMSFSMRSDWDGTTVADVELSLIRSV